MRTPEVEEAMHATEMLRPFAGEWLSPNNQYVLILAAEVERLEAHCKQVGALFERVEQRAEAAEARVEELEVGYAKWYRRCASLVYALPGNVCAGELQKWEADYTTGLARAEARVRELEAQNARLREMLFKLRGAAHHAEIWLTSCLECKDWMWSEHQHEAATIAKDELKAALADERAAP